MSSATVSRDVEYLESSARQALGTLLEKRLPHEHDKCLKGLDQVLHEAWIVENQTKSDNTKLQPLALIQSTYTTRLALVADANIVSRALDFVQKGKEQLRTMTEMVSSEAIETEEEVF